MAAQATVPVDIEVDLPQQPPYTIEVIAYIVVAEALTNSTEHACASELWVRVATVGDRVRVEVRDNGRGGATPTPGGGLPGLRTRVAAVGGEMDVTSPAGGPTIVRAEVPCES